MKWISEWRCSKCQKTAWGRGKAPKQKLQFVMVYRALLCKTCKRPMLPTGKELKTYTTAELL